MTRRLQIDRQCEHVHDKSIHVVDHGLYGLQFFVAFHYSIRVWSAKENKCFRTCLDDAAVALSKSPSCALEWSCCLDIKSNANARRMHRLGIVDGDPKCDLICCDIGRWYDAQALFLQHLKIENFTIYHTTAWNIGKWLWKSTFYSSHKSVHAIKYSSDDFIVSFSQIWSEFFLWTFHSRVIFWENIFPHWHSARQMRYFDWPAPGSNFIDS